jgi:hypothetical protein
MVHETAVGVGKQQRPPRYGGIEFKKKRKRIVKKTKKESKGRESGGDQTAELF